MRVYIETQLVSIYLTVCWLYLLQCNFLTDTASWQRHKCKHKLEFILFSFNTFSVNNLSSLQTRSVWLNMSNYEKTFSKQSKPSCMCNALKQVKANDNDCKQRGNTQFMDVYTDHIHSTGNNVLSELHILFSPNIPSAGNLRMTCGEMGQNHAQATISTSPPSPMQA